MVSERLGGWLRQRLKMQSLVQKSNVSEDDDLKDLFIHPPYWLMYALPWPSQDPGVTMAEAAFVLAPKCVSRKGLPKDVDDVLGFTGLYAREHPGQRMIWFTDVTRWLGTQGSDWSALGVNWEEALTTLTKMPILSIYMTVSYRAYCHLIDTAQHFTMVYLDGTSEELTPEERQKVHDAFEEKLDNTWPPYIRQMLANGRLTIG